MPSAKGENKHTRIISLFLVYVLFSQELISFSYGCQSLMDSASLYEFGVRSENFVTDSGDTISVTNTTQNTKEIKTFQKVSKGFSGPGQAESSGFSLNSTDGMVDKFTGDFSYSIPLMDVEGYPISLSYNSNVSMNQDASWVGLGWDLNVGAVSREMRGVPDEFNGEQEIVRTFNEKQDETVDAKKIGGYFGIGGEIPIPGFKGVFMPSGQVTALFGNYNNSILGFGKTTDIGLQAQFSLSNSDKTQAVGLGFGLNYSRDTKGGIGINKNFGVTASASSEKDGLGASAGGSLTFGSSFNSRKGITSKSISVEGNGGYLNDKYLGGDGSIGTGSTVMYGTQTFMPRINANLIGTSKSNDFKAYVNFLTPGDMIFSVGGMYKEYEVKNTLNIENHQIVEPAFGYMHSGKRKDYNVEGKYPVMDYNRTSESSYSEEMKNLPFSIQTYDVFYANAMGLTGTFRARRTDFGTYYDPEASVKINDKKPIEDVGDLLDNLTDVDNVGVGVGATIGVGADPSLKLHIELSAGYMPGTIESGVLKSGSSNVLEFNTQSASSNFDQSIYFKAVGESTPEEMAAYNQLNGAVPDYFLLKKEGDHVALTNQLNGTQAFINSGVLNGLNPSSTPKPVIATHFAPKTAASFPVNASYKSFPLVGSGNSNVEQITRVGGIREVNHITAIDVVSTDGMIYQYGLPVYTINNQEVSFAATGLTKVTSDPGLITYTPVLNGNGENIGVNSVTNSLGWTGYFDKTKMPAYAHSFLLTEMKSSDYLDRLGDGLTLDDAGSYYKFNYTRVYGTSNPYKWRYPVSGGSEAQAMISEGLLGSNRDDMAHYTYGEKEIWYTHSVESKNMIAEFVLEDREDGYSVNGENGGLDTDKPLKLLKKIVLYNRAEKLANPSGAIPLQTVEFEYDYSLCLLSPNNKHSYAADYDKPNSGKLTLKAIRVYSGTSKEMGLSKYAFEYNSTVNPDFNYSNVDGWGNYKPNDVNRPNDIYPYAEQNLTEANNNVLAYKLVAINNPMGGRTEISYEADCYQYVQDKRAMRHFDVAGMTDIFNFLNILNGNSWTPTNVAQLSTAFTKGMTYSQILDLVDGNDQSNLISKLFSAGGLLTYTAKFGIFNKDLIPNNVMIFKLENPIPATATTTIEVASQQIKDQYFKDPTQGPNAYLKNLFFKMMVDVKAGTNTKEMVPCFADISDDYSNIFYDLAGLSFIDNFKAIGVMPVASNSANNEFEYGYVVLDPLNSGDQENGGKKGEDGYGMLMHPLQRSALDYVRQNLPDVIYGSCAGCQTDLSIDNAVAAGKDMYKFMLKEGIYVHHFIPASTVRLFEYDNIKFGGNARVFQITYKDNWNTISGEYLSSYTWNYSYPERFKSNGVASYETRALLDENPLYKWDTYVNYNKKFPDESKFNVVPLADALYPIPVVGYEEVRVTFSGGTTKGYSSSTFYTAKDFPTKEKKTTINSAAKLIDHTWEIIGKTIDLYGFSQGYAVETNDYHGKPKEMNLYNKLGELQSRSTYRYYGFNEEVKMMDRAANLVDETIALEYDMHTDSRFIHDETKFTDVGIKLSWKILPVISPIPVPSPIFFKTSAERGFYSNVLIKHINRSAVLKGIETEYMGSINKAENLVYDRFTGNVLLSSLTDEFNDKLYSMSYPSHWYYSNLRDISGADYASRTGTITTGTFSMGGIDLRDLYAPGDVLTMTNVNGVQEDAWVLQVNQGTLILINELGAKYPLSGSFTIKLEQTIRKNRLNETMQSVVTKKSPLSGSYNVFTFPFNEIISANAITYRMRNNVRCGTPGWDDGHGTSPNNEVVKNAAVNPFLYGAKGDLVMDKQFAWQDERTNLGNNGIRLNGVYATYFPFYNYTPASLGNENWYKVNESGYVHINSTDWNVNKPYQKWKNLGRVTLYNEYGSPLESKDQLGIYSAVLYGYNSTLDIVPVAQAVNTMQQNIAFDGFEDYNYYSTFDLENDQTHFDFISALNPGTIEVQTIEKHSGLGSLKMAPNTVAQVSKGIGHAKSDESCGNSETEGIISGEYKPNDCLCIKPFEPTEGEYIVSVWVKEDNSLNKESYLNGKVEIKVNGASVAAPFLPSGPIIDGWQRLEAQFEIEENMQTIDVRLLNTSTTENVYFDDFRIHPVLAGMTTVVYDPKTLLPMASHDGYNFTTFFNYDENLNQVRIRVETERGIQTISETEFGGQKSFH